MNAQLVFLPTIAAVTLVSTLVVAGLLFVWFKSRRKRVLGDDE